MEKVTIHKSWFQAIKGLDTDEKRWKALCAILSYALDGVEDCDCAEASLALGLARPQIEEDRRAYEAGKKGGRPPKKGGLKEGVKGGLAQEEKEEEKEERKERSKEKKEEKEEEKEDFSFSVEKEKEDREKILIKFFRRNLANPHQEVRRYLAWGASIGWKKNNGTPIIDKIAYCSFWKPETAEKKHRPEVLAILSAAIDRCETAEERRDIIRVLSRVNGDGITLFWPQPTKSIEIVDAANAATLSIPITHQVRIGK